MVELVEELVVETDVELGSRVNQNELQAMHKDLLKHNALLVQSPCSTEMKD